MSLLSSARTEKPVFTGTEPYTARAESLALTSSIDHPSARESEAVKFKRNVVFHLTRWTVSGFCALGALGVAQQLTGDRWAVLRFNVYLLALLFWRWGSRIATFLCRCLGLSLEATNIESVEKSNPTFSNTPQIVAPLIIERNKSEIFIMPVCATLLCAICFGPALLQSVPPSRDWPRTCVLTLIFSGCLTVAIFSWRNLRKPALKIDDHGVAHCGFAGLSSRFVPWTKIVSCDAVSVRNVFGEVNDKYLVFKDARQKQLLTVRFDSNAPFQNFADLDRTTERIKAEWA